jgi:hypothetical protein
MSHAYLFVYGTLRRDINSEMCHFLARYGKFVGTPFEASFIWWITTLVSCRQITRKMLFMEKFTI